MIFLKNNTDLKCSVYKVWQVQQFCVQIKYFLTNTLWANWCVWMTDTALGYVGTISCGLHLKCA